MDQSLWAKIFGTYRIHAGRPAINIYAPLAAALQHANRRQQDRNVLEQFLADVRTGLAYQLIRNIYRYRSAEFYDLTLEARLKLRVQRMFLAIVGTQPRPVRDWCLSAFAKQAWYQGLSLNLMPSPLRTEAFAADLRRAYDDLGQVYAGLGPTFSPGRQDTFFRQSLQVILAASPDPAALRRNIMLYGSWLKQLPFLSTQTLLIDGLALTLPSFDLSSGLNGIVLDCLGKANFAMDEGIRLSVERRRTTRIAADAS